MVALIVALGGFLMGFDASVISGVNEFIEPYFNLSKIELGWAVASLTLTATLAMLVAGPLSDKYGRKFILKIAAVLFAVSAIASALAPTFLFLVIARMIGGLGVGAALIIAPMYIAEISPPKIRGQMVSFNQLNIVVGISAAFFSNYLILKLGQPGAPAWAESLKIGEYNWRWMLGLETLPAVLYFIGLFFVPRSPRWLMMKGEFDEALSVMKRSAGEERAKEILDEVKLAISSDKEKTKTPLAELFRPAMKMVLTIGVVVAVLQQITGINSVFFYAPMIFKQSGIGQDAAFSQAILVGLINLVFTVIAILLIDRVGRKPLLKYGVAGIAIFMFVLATGFWTASYTLTDASLANLPAAIEQSQLEGLVGQTFENDIAFKAAINDAVGSDVATEY
jgi:sugar porter (SP) family MFS transporter